MTYRLEKYNDYTVNGHKDVEFIFEHESQSEVRTKFYQCCTRPHWGHYRIIKEELICDEKSTRTDEVEDNETQLQDPDSLSVGSSSG